jgi:hypothetical protein
MWLPVPVSPCCRVSLGMLLLYNLAAHRCAPPPSACTPLLSCMRFMRFMHYMYTEPCQAAVRSASSACCHTRSNATWEVVLRRCLPLIWGCYGPGRMDAPAMGMNVAWLCGCCLLQVAV